MNWDTVSDQQIESCLGSETFQNLSLLYPYENRNWELRIIFNPHYEKIALNNGQFSMFRFYYGVFTQESIPERLESHLKEIIERELKSSSGGFWSISSIINGKLSIDYFADAVAIPETELSQTDSKNEVLEETIQINEESNDVDQAICEMFKEQTFRRLSLNYEWKGKFYSVHFVHNPTRETLFDSSLSNPVRWPFAVTIEDSSYPLPLANHLKSLVPDELLRDSDSMVDIANRATYYRKHSVSLYTTLHPITLLDRIENPNIDVEILNIFSSDQFTEKSLYYELDGNFYKVFLIHNPQKLTLKSTLGFDTWENGYLSCTVTWNSKIGIFVDKEAPQELIDHISQLYKLSWWDCYWNLSIHNGDKKTITHFKGSWEYKYSPYSWYTFMVNAEL